ncbi:MAG: type I secretion system permease/ATPase [Rhizobiaceae bacterium]
MGSAANPDTSSRLDDNNLLQCLKHVCERFSIPFDSGKALEGLPADGYIASAEIFERACANCGLHAQTIRLSPSEISPLTPPCVVLLKEGGGLVVDQISRRTGQFEVSLPSAETGSPLKRTLARDELSALGEGRVILVSPSDGADHGDDDSYGMAAGRTLLMRSFSAYWPSWMLVIISAAVINLLALASPLFIMNVYDRVIPNLAIPTLWALTAGVLIALVFDSLLRIMRAQLLDHTGNRVDMRIGAQLFSHVMRIRLDHFPAGTGELANTIREFETVRDFFTSASLVALTDFLFIGIFLVVLWYIAGPLVLVPTTAVVVVLVITLIARFPIASGIRRTMRHVSERQTLLVESLGGMEAIRAAGAEGKQQQRWERAIMAASTGASGTKFWSALASASTGLVLQLVSVTTIVWGVFLVLDGAMTVGGLIAANILSGRVLSPLSSISQTLARSGQAFQAMRRLSLLLELPVEGGQTTPGLQPQKGAIEFKDVTFAYSQSINPALVSVSFRIKAGERVGIIGANGSGKTTAGKLISGLFEANEGKVLIDGNDIRQFSRQALRRSVSYAAQEPVLFSGSIRDNIAMGAATPSEAEIGEAAELSGVNAFARLMPDGLGSMLAERGANLSGGQRQAVSLARNLVRKPLVLFLDEPTSAMDSISEAGFIERLDRFCGKERTLLIATHKANILSIVERIIVLDKGRVVADGPREVVLAGLKRNARPVKRTEEPK